MLRLYDFLESGNGYKVRLLLAQLGRRFERVELDILAGETRTPEHLARNPNGRIPVLELEDGSHLAESNDASRHLRIGTEGHCATAPRRRSVPRASVAATASAAESGPKTVRLRRDPTVRTQGERR